MTPHTLLAAALVGVAAMVPGSGTLWADVASIPVSPVVTEESMMLSIPLPTVRANAGMTVTSAQLEWACPGLRNNFQSEFVVHKLDAAAIRGTLGTQSMAPSEPGDPVAVVRRYRPRTTGPMSDVVRLDVTAVIQEALDAGAPSIDVSISSSGMSGGDLASSTRLPILKLKYGYLGPAANLFKSSEMRR